MDHSQLPYRQGVGLCLFNREGLVLVAERRDRPDAWQMPQGGVQKDEAPQAAALREMKEEIGTDKAEIIGQVPEPIGYEFPDWAQHKGDKPYRGKYRGQQQTWFALRFLGDENDISLEGEHEPETPEFTAWKWIPIAELVNVIVDFKRPVYERVVKEFAPIADRIKRGEKVAVWKAENRRQKTEDR